jgi:predicted transcriptional regulator
MLKTLKKKRNTISCKHVEAIKEESHTSLKELQENTTKQVKELKKTIQDLNMRIKTIKEITRGDNPGG